MPLKTKIVGYNELIWNENVSHTTEIITVPLSLKKKNSAFQSGVERSEPTSEPVGSGMNWPDQSCWSRVSPGRSGRHGGLMPGPAAGPSGTTAAVLITTSQHVVAICASISRHARRSLPSLPFPRISLICLPPAISAARPPATRLTSLN